MAVLNAGGGNAIIDRNNPNINELADYNYGVRLKSGDNTTLKYMLSEGDLEEINLEGKVSEAVLMHDNMEAYRTSARLDAKNSVAYFHIDKALRPDPTPYVVEIVVTDPTKEVGEADHTRIFPSGKGVTLEIVPSSASATEYVIENAGEERLRTIVLGALDNVAEFKEATEIAKSLTASENERQEAERIRLQAERDRVASEEARKLAEQSRTTAEEQRATAEDQRQMNESERQNNYTALDRQAKSTIESLDAAAANAGLYTAGEGIVIDPDGRINADIDLSILDSKIDEPTSDGTSGQFLMTDGRGKRTWETVETTNTTYTAGQNVKISPDNVISATDTDTTYGAGENINIDETNRISAIDTKYDDSEIRRLIDNKQPIGNYATTIQLSEKADRNHTHDEYAVKADVDSAILGHRTRIDEVEGAIRELNVKINSLELGPKVEVVSDLPDRPDPNTFYVVK